MAGGVVKRVWLVTIGGSDDSAKDAKVLSRHSTFAAAQKAAIQKRSELYANRDLTTPCGVKHLDSFLVAGGVLS